MWAGTEACVSAAKDGWEGGWAEGLSHTFVVPGRDAGLEAVAAAAPAVIVVGKVRSFYCGFTLSHVGRHWGMCVCC